MSDTVFDVFVACLRQKHVWHTTSLIACPFFLVHNYIMSDHYLRCIGFVIEHTSTLVIIKSNTYHLHSPRWEERKSKLLLPIVIIIFLASCDCQWSKSIWSVYQSFTTGYQLDINPLINSANFLAKETMNKKLLMPMSYLFGKFEIGGMGKKSKWSWRTMRTDACIMNWIRLSDGRPMI